MTVGLASAVAIDFLEWFAGSATATAPAAFWIELHIGDPGNAGTANIAGNATRKQVSFGAASGGIMSNDAAITWTTGEVDTAEDYTHWAAFSLASGGTFLCSGLMTANAVLVGDEFTIPIGDLDLSFIIAA